ncbi:MAG: DUF1559 domain-containing protein [Armatimonadetes bacterium]|nr:DUF1559 domain-containing protein [Armatimonadota bacterium]
MGRKQGFTLVEILVVIAIIAVLAAILFPVFSRVRENARKTNCLSNLNQVGVAMRAYSSDYGGYIVNWCVSHPACAATPGWPAPPAESVKNDPADGVVTWDLSIMRYLKSDKVLLCPSNKNPRTDVGRAARAYAIARYTQKVVAGGIWGPSLGMMEGDFPKPTETVLLFEKGNNLPGSWGDACGENVFESHNGPLIDQYAPNDNDEQTSGGQTINVRMFHGDGKNILFLDGHAKYFTKTTGPFAKVGASYAVPGMVFTRADIPQ